jgi:hypothetical protein
LILGKDRVKVVKRTGQSPFFEVYSAQGGRAISHHMLKGDAQAKAKKLSKKTGKSYLVWLSKPVAKVSRRK